MSFRVRLLHINYKDSKEKAKSYSQYGFLIEDMKDLADRNNCVERKKGNYGADDGDRIQSNLVCLFQFMIGNTDWSLRQFHNIKLMAPKNDTLAMPYVIPYDFDFAGMVDAEYATPSEIIGTETVKERAYRGFPRPLEEINKAISLLEEKKNDIYKLINAFDLVPASARKEIIKYFDEFYETVKNKREVQKVFIDNARAN